MSKTTNTILLLIVMAIAYVICCVLFFDWFTDNFFFLALLAIFTLYFYNKNGKKIEIKAAEQKQAKIELEELGFVKFHAKEIIKNYGTETFLNKTQKEVEIAVYEYNDLFKARFSEQEIVDIAHDIYNEVNK